MAASLKRIDIDLWKSKIDQKEGGLMHARVGNRQLQVLHFAKAKAGNWDDETCSVESRDIEDNSQLERLRDESEDCSRIFVVRQRRSWDPLYISRKLFECLFKQWDIFPLFWKFIIPLGKKSDENEFEFPGFRARRTVNSNNKLGDRYESAYILRRVELHNANVLEGQSLYSIRQTAVYHSWTPASETVTAQSFFLLVAPSRAIDSCLEHHVDYGTISQQDIAPWNFHRLLVADSLGGWIDYMASLYVDLQKLSDLIVLAPIEDEKEGLSSLADVQVNFVTRQNLKLVEDCILNLQVILQTLLSTVTDVRSQCKIFKKSQNLNEEEKIDLELAIDEFDEDVREVEILLKRAQRLREKAASTTQLLADLLNYEDAVALKNLAQESHKESKSMHVLAEISNRDSAAVKVLTIITLFYLPTTIVANFFSTEFVHTTDDGKLQISDDSWLLAVVAIPLTALTLVAWWAWVYYMRKSPAPLAQISLRARILRQNTFRSFWTGSFWSSKSSLRDLEKGKVADGDLEKGEVADRNLEKAEVAVADGDGNGRGRAWNPRGWFGNLGTKTPLSSWTRISKSS